jgi:hypothetical protein
MKNITLMAVFTGLALFLGGIASAQTVTINARPSHIDLSSATAESAVKVTAAGYSSDDARYRLYVGGNQYNCWDSGTNAYISSTTYANGPRIPGTPSTSSTWWIVFQRGNNATTGASYRDRLNPYTANYQTLALPAAVEIVSPATPPFTISGTVQGTATYPTSVKYVVLGFDAETGGNLVTACATSYESDDSNGTFALVAPLGTTIRRVEFRTVLDVTITQKTGTYSATTDVGTVILQADDVSVTPPDHNYGTLLQSTTASYGFTVANAAGASQNLVINSPGFTFSGSNPGKFSVTTTGFPITVTPGNSTTINIQYAPGAESGASHSAIATLVSNSPYTKTAALSGSTYQDVANIAALRAAGAGAKVRLTGTAVATVPTGLLSPTRNQLYIQDTSGADGRSAVCIDDPNFRIGQNLALGDRISNIVGVLSDYNGLLQFVPDAGFTPTFPGLGTLPVALVVTGAITDFETIESELIQVNGVDVAEEGSWAAGTNYLLTAPGGLIVDTIRISGNSEAAGQAIPTGTFDVMGIAVPYNTSNQIQPRYALDIGILSVPDWEQY